MAAAHRLMVVGGNGLVGSAVCRAAVQRGMEVCSISRSGTAPSTAAWTTKVDWNAADALKPETYEHLLEKCDTVVHTVGTLMENNQYKRLLRSGPVASYDFEDGKSSYETVNRDTAVQVGQLASELPNVGKFVYVSAAAAPPGVDARYIETKREAEDILKFMPSVETYIFRPGFMYSDDPRYLALALALRAPKLISSLVPPLQSLIAPFLKPFEAVTVAPLPLHIVSQAIVQAALAPSGEHGTFEVEGIEALAEQSYPMNP